MYLKMLYHGNANLPYTLRIPVQILYWYTGIVRLSPVIYLLFAFYTQSKPTPTFSLKATYTPSCLTQTQKEVFSSQLHWLLVYFGHLYNENYIVKNPRFLDRAPLM